MKFKRFLSFALALLMVISYVPVNAFAEETANDTTINSEETPNESSETPSETPVDESEIAPIADEEVVDTTIDSEAELSAALAAGGTVTLGGSFEVANLLTISTDTVLDLNGCTLNLAGLQITNGTVEIKNGSLIGTTSSYSTVETYTVNGGVVNLTLNNVNVTGAKHAVRAKGGNIIINSGVYTTSGTDGTYYVLNIGDDADATVTVNGGQFVHTGKDSGGSAVLVYNGSTLIVNGGEFTGSALSSYIFSNATVTIYGGSFDSDASAYVAPGYEQGADGTVVKEAASGTITPAYTSRTGIWGEGGGNATQSLVVELYEGNAKIASASLNNINGIIDGDVYVTWNIPFAGSTDEYWTVTWADGYPNINMAPDKVVMVIDGTVVAANNHQWNAADNLNKIVALAEGYTGGVVAYTSLAEAMGSFNGRKVNVLCDVSEAIEEMSGCTLTTNVEGGVTITNTVGDYIYAMDCVIGEGVTVVTSAMFFQGGENTILGRLEVDNDQFGTGAIYYQGYDAIVNIKDGGSVDVEGSVIFRYNEDEGALNIYGDGDDSTVEFACDYYIGAYSGTFYAEDANIETGYFLLKNSYDDSSYADIAMTLDNSSVKVVGTTDGQDSFIIDDQASLTLVNGASVEDVRDFNILSGANLTLSVDETSAIKATSMSIADDVNLGATQNEDGSWNIVKQIKGLSGEGTEASPYLINDLDELIWFRDHVDSCAQDGSSQYTGKYVKLTADIDLSGINWNPIGETADHGTFNGTFDGDGHTISNLYINSDGDHLGFFARTSGGGDGAQAVIKNLKFRNVDVSSNSTTSHAGSYVGGVIANSGGNTVISNVHVTGNVYVVGYGYVGGIVGHGYPDIDNCHVNANAGSYVNGGYWCVGGIIGYAGEGGTPITNCSVSGLKIWSAYGAAAAVAGLLQDGNTVSNVSASNVEITSNSDYVMGYIAGNGEASTLTNVTATNVTAAANGVAITATDVIATVNGVQYFSLLDAINAANAGETVSLLRDTTAASGLEIAADKDVKLDLAGNEIVAEITVNGVLEVNDSVGGGKVTGTITAGANAYIFLYAGTYTQDVSDWAVYPYGAVDNGDGTYTVKLEVEATIGTRPYETLADAIAAVREGQTIVLQGNVTTVTLNISEDVTIDLNGYTLTVTERNNLNSAVTIENGTLNITGAVADGDALFCIGASTNATLTLNGVNVVGNGYSSAYAVFYVYNTSTLNIEDSTVTLANEQHDAGGFIKAEQGKDGIVNITDSVINLTDAKIGFLDGTVTLDGVELTIKGGANAINGSALTVIDSTVTIDGADGRAITLNQGDVTIENSTLNLSNCSEGEIRFKSGLTLSTDASSTISDCTVYADASAVGTANVYGAIVTGSEDNKSQIVNGELVNPDWAAKVGENEYYATIAEAIAAAEAGETVTIYAGEYTGNVSVDKAITVVGEGEVVINGKLNITADGATVKNLTVKSNGTACYVGAKDVLIEGCDLSGSNGLYQSYTSGLVTFKDSKITGNVYGIHFDGNAGGEIVIEGCEITGWTSFASTIEKVTMKDTKFLTGNYNYIRFYQSEVVIDGCTFNENMGIDVANSVSADVTVNNCTVENGGNVEDLFEGNDIINSTITVDGVELVRVAKIGDVYYETIDEAFAAAVDGDTITVLDDVTMTEVFDVKDMTLTIDGTGTLDVNDKLTVHGESTLNISCPMATNQVLLGDGAILKDSTISGNVFVYGNVTFRGANTVGMLYDFGTLTDYYGSEANMAWTVEPGASLTMTTKARYGLGYGDNVTIKGELTEDATRDSLTEEDASFFTHGLVAQESAGWNCDSSLTVEDAYVIIGSNNSFGNKPGNYGGTYTFNFENAVLDSSRITFYEADSTTKFNITGSDVKTGTFMTRDADSVFTLTDSVLLSTTTTNGTDEGNYHAGKLVLSGSALTYSAPLVMENGVIELDLSSTITAPSITGTGKIVIDATGFSGQNTQVITADMTGFTGEIKVIGAVYTITDTGIVIEAAKARVGDTYYANLDEVFADSNLSGEVTVELLDDVSTDNQVDTAYGTTYNFVTNVEGGVTMNWNYATNWNYVQFMSIGENITLNVGRYLLVWSELEISGTVNAGYAYFFGADVTVNEGAELNVTTQDKTVQVKSGTTLTVNGTVNAGTVNVWAGSSKLIVSDENASLNASWIDIWDGTPSVTIENGATLTTDAIKASRGGSITVDGATLDADSIELGHNGESAGTLTINNGVVTGETTLSAVGSTLTGPKGMNVVTNVADHVVVYGNGVYSVVPATDVVATIGEMNFASLQDALDAAADTDVITIVATTVIEEDTTIDLGGHTLVAEGVYPVIRVQNNANVTIGNGSITADDYIFVLGASDASSSGYLTIKSGTYHGNVTVASVTMGELVIEGGYFSVDPYTGAGYANYNYLLNCIDSNYAYGTANIVVKGGSFENFNPADNAAEGLGTNFVEYLYESVTSNGSVWNVREIAAGDSRNPIWLYAQENDETISGETWYQGYFNGMIMTVTGEGYFTVIHNDEYYWSEDGKVEIVVSSANPRMPVLFAVDGNGNYSINFTYPVGSMMNPAQLVIGDNTATIEAGNSQGYYFTWIATFDGALTITMPEGGWMYTINNLTTYSYGDTQWSDSDPVVNPAIVEFAEGDELQVIVSTYDPANPWSAPVGELTFNVAEGYPAGHEQNPIDLTSDLLYEDDFAATVTVPAGKTYHYIAYRVGGMIMSINGGEGVTCVTDGMWYPYAWTITNDGETDAEYMITVEYPVGNSANPDTLVIGENTAAIEAGAQGYYYTWVATDDGELTITMPEGNWMYVINNVTAGTYGDTQWSDSDPVVNPAVVALNKGEEIQVMVNGYDPADMWNTPAGDIVFTAEFVAAPGTEANPIGLFAQENTVTAAGTSYDDVTYYYGYFGGMNLTVSGNGEFSVLYNGNTYTAVDGVVTIEGLAAMGRMPVNFAIDGNGDYTISAAYPVGSMQNPAQLVIGDNTATIEAGNTQGYYFTWIATGNGELTITMPEGDWMFAVNNMTTYVYGDTQWSDTEPQNPYTIVVNEGDEIQVMVNGYDPADMWNTPAGDIVFTAEFMIPVAQNVQTGVKYGSVSEALAAAASGETVILVANAEEDMVYVRAGRTLDLNGKTLTANDVITVNSAHVIDGTRNGLLKINNDIVLNVNNKEMAFWNGEGYVFGTYITNDAKYGAPVDENGTLKYKFYTQFSGAVQGLIIDNGNSDNNISVVIRLTWNTEDGTAFQNYVYNDDQVAAVGTGDYSFSFSLSDYAELDGLTLTTLIISETGVESVGASYVINE